MHDFYKKRSVVHATTAARQPGKPISKILEQLCPTVIAYWAKNYVTT